MREMLDYGVDGLYLCIRSHSPWPARGSREYGYNPPVMDAVDPIAAGRMFVDMDALARERTLDELSFLAGTTVDLTRSPMLSDGRVWLTVFAGIHGKTYEECLPQVRNGIAGMLRNATADGACFHELANVYYLDLWEEGIGAAYR